MKKYIFILALAAIGFSSCSDFLDVQAEGYPTVDSYFVNDQQAIDAIDGLYAPVQQEKGFGRNLFWEQAAACDIVWGRSRGYNTLATLKYTGDESPLRGNYSLFTSTVARANFVIKELLNKGKSKQLTPVEHRSLGEAYFMRGMSHFMIAYRYGVKEQGVPFMRYEDLEGEYDNQIPVQQASVEDNYQYIIEDMDKAIEYLPKFEEYSVDDRGRAHQAAAVAYKAKVYAYWATWNESKWSDVISMVTLLENQYGRGLADTYDELFSSEFSDYWNREYLWSIPGNGGVKGGGVEFIGVILENKGWGKYNGWGQFKPSNDIYEEMAKDGVDNDRLRRSILAYNQEFQYFGETRRYYSSSDIESGFQINKYMDPFKHKNAIEDGYVNPNGNWPTARLNFPLVRFAEMLLFRAEAYLMTGDAGKAKADLNRIRERSNLAPITEEATMAHLYHERRCELAFEYTDHLFDLKRWARSSNTEIRELALKELNAHPTVRIYENREDPESTFEVGPYADYQDKQTYQDYLMVFPYPSDVVVNSNGKLKQNPGYN